MDIKIVKKLTFAVLLIFSITLLSCEFEPTEKYSPNISKPTEIPAIKIDLNFQTDTINYYWNAPLELTIDAGKLDIKYVKFFIDETEIIGQSNGSVYSIDMNVPKPGTYKLRMSITTNTATNSIADKIGAEGYIYNSREWTIVAREINTTVNLIPHIDSNGLSFSWPEYDGLNMKYYELKESSTGISNYIDTNSFNYSDYTGVPGNFELYVVDNKNVKQLWGKTYLNSSLPLLKLQTVNNQLYLTWNKTIFSKNLAEFQVNQIVNYTRIKIANVSINDTCTLIDIPYGIFAQDANFELQCIPKNISYNYNFSSHLSDMQHIALQGPKCYDAIGTSCLGFYYKDYSTGDSYGTLMQFSTQTNQIKKIKTSLFIQEFSPQAKYLLEYSNSIFYVRDLLADQVIKSVDMRKYVSSFNFNGHPQISDNGIASFSVNDTLYVFNLLNEELLAKQANLNVSKISSNGEYLLDYAYNKINLYQIKDNSINLINTCYINADYDKYGFCNDNSNNIFIVDGASLLVKSPIDFSTIRSFSIGKWFYNIDFCSNKVLSCDENRTWLIHDFNSGALIQTVFSDIGTGAPNYTLICNNTIFYTAQGLKYILNN